MNVEIENNFENDDDFMEEYEKSMYDLIQYMYSNSIFNTYVTNVDEENEFTIILKTHKPKMKDLLSHLGKYHRIKQNDELIKERCIICFDDYKPKECIRTLNKCSHTFHKKCVDKWFRKNQGQMNCPVCRTNYDKRIVL